jgi:hypothetical protein
MTIRRTASLTALGAAVTVAARCLARVVTLLGGAALLRRRPAGAERRQRRPSRLCSSSSVAPATKAKSLVKDGKVAPDQLSALRELALRGGNGG